RSGGEGCRPASQVEVADVFDGLTGDRAVTSVLLEVHAVHAPGITQVRVRPQHQSVDDAEHRGVRADAETERDDRAEREPWGTSKSADGVADVLLQVVEPWYRPQLARLLVDPGHVAEAASRGPVGLRRVVARRACIALELCAMELQLLPQFGVEAVASKPVEDSCTRFT